MFLFNFNQPHTSVHENTHVHPAKGVNVCEMKDGKEGKERTQGDCAGEMWENDPFPKQILHVCVCIMKPHTHWDVFVCMRVCVFVSFSGLLYRMWDIHALFSIFEATQEWGKFDGKSNFPFLFNG